MSSSECDGPISYWLCGCSCPRVSWRNIADVLKHQGGRGYNPCRKTGYIPVFLVPKPSKSSDIEMGTKHGKIQGLPDQDATGDDDGKKLPKQKPAEKQYWIPASPPDLDDGPQPPAQGRVNWCWKVPEGLDPAGHTHPQQDRDGSSQLAHGRRNVSQCCKLVCGLSTKCGLCSGLANWSRAECRLWGYGGRVMNTPQGGDM
mmetsp:Transcript_16230/g.32046  ORF Transcript_16230/g.32046 Transcript_16230/m.32046 type:complete len:201 (-) Transcript_16230:210-812(-)